MYVRIVNRRADGTKPRHYESVIAVDRTNRILGNPHVMDNLTMNERMRVIQAFQEDEQDDYNHNGPMTQAIKDLASRVESGEYLALQCWCAPLPCHAQVIRNRISSILGRDVTPADEKT